MRRREFIALVGGAMAAGPLAARAQSSKMPVIGFLNIGSRAAFASFVAAFHEGLNATGHVEGKNVAIEYRWAEGDYERLREHAADLVRRQVSVIVATGGTVSARAAKNATDTIPILFIAGVTPVREGLVASFSRPEGNATGVSVYTGELVRKWLELLRELVPAVDKFAVLLNPETPSSQFERLDAEKAAEGTNLGLTIVEVSDEGHFEKAFESVVAAGSGGLIVTADGYFTSKRAQIIQLAARHKLPTIYPWREYPMAGGLMSYGPSIKAAYQLVGTYAGRILSGAKPGDLPVQLPMVFELVFNLTAAKALGLNVSPWLLARADEVIE